MSIANTNSVPRFFGYSIISDDYVSPKTKNEFEYLFGANSGYYEKLENDLTLKLCEIIEIDSLSELKNDICTDCEESNIVYKFYANQIIKKINELHKYRNEARELLTNYQDTNLGRLQILDTFCKKIEVEFAHHYAYDPEEEVFKIIEEGYNSTTYCVSQLEKSISKFDDLRNEDVACYPGKTSSVKKTLDCFNELNLLDRLKFIKLYYKCSSGKTDSLFPNEKKEESYPAVKESPNVVPNKETYFKAQLELFYIGYLIDRDGPLGALCSFVELKAVALLKNIELETMRLKALNGYLAYMNRALISLNSVEKGIVPNDTYGICSVICSGILRNIKQLTIDGVTSDYLVIQRDFTNEDNLNVNTVNEEGYHLSATNYYILVKLQCGVSKAIDYAVDSPFFTDRTLGDDKKDNIITVTNCPEGMIFYKGFKWTDQYNNTYTFEDGENFLIAKTKNYNQAKEFLPKELDINPIVFSSVYNGINNDVEKQRRTQSWQTTIQNYIENINIGIESINTDIEVWRTKMDTWDSLANKIRHRDYEIRQNLISRSLH